jgi:hypothetical protein
MDRRPRRISSASFAAALLAIVRIFSPEPARAAEPETAPKACYKFAGPAPRHQAEWNVDPACKVFLANVNDFCGDESFDHEFRVSAKRLELTLPRWTPVRAQLSSRGLIETMIRASVLVSLDATREGRYDRAWELFQPDFDAALAKDSVLLATTTLRYSDVDKPDLVYRLDLGQTGLPVKVEPRLVSERLIRLYRDLESRNSLPLVPVDNVKEQVFAYRGADPFFYKGRTYFYEHPFLNTVLIREFSHSPLCAFVPRQ